LEEESEDDESDAGDEASSSEQGLDWDELEQKAMEADAKKEEKKVERVRRQK